MSSERFRYSRVQIWSSSAAISGGSEIVIGFVMRGMTAMFTVTRQIRQTCKLADVGKFEIRYDTGSDRRSKPRWLTIAVYEKYDGVILGGPYRNEPRTFLRMILDILADDDSMGQVQ